MAITLNEGKRRNELARMKKWKPEEYAELQKLKHKLAVEKVERKELERYNAKQNRIKYLQRKYEGGYYE